MPFCHNCGMKILETSYECPKCRTPVPGKKPPKKAAAKPAAKKPVKKEARRIPDAKEYLKRDGEERKRIGAHLIQISRHGGSCDLCKPFENKVLIDDVYSGGTFFDKYKDYKKVPSKYRAHVAFLSEAMREGLFHDGCRHGAGTFFVDLL